LDEVVLDLGLELEYQVRLEELEELELVLEQQVS
jgi:hypothetical protein